MDKVIYPRPQKFTRRALENRIGDVRVRPFNQDAVTVIYRHRDRWQDCRGVGIPSGVKPRESGVIGEG